MPRTRYYRKRPGYRTYVSDLWHRLLPLMAPSSPQAPQVEHVSEPLLNRLSEPQVAELAESASAAWYCPPSLGTPR